MSQRVNIQYSVELDKLPDTVSALYDSAMLRMKKLNNKMLSFNSALDLEMIEQIDYIRLELTQVDIELADIDRIVKGYIQFKTEEKELLTELVTLVENRSTYEEEIKIYNLYKPLMILLFFLKILDISVFDEWIGNGDRNIGNILYDGKSLFNFIDHELALPEGLSKDNRATKNQLLSSCFSTLSEFEKHKASKNILNGIHPQMSGMDLKSALDNCLASIYFNEADAEEIKDIVRDRLSTLAQHSDLRMGIKQQGLAI